MQRHVLFFALALISLGSRAQTTDPVTATAPAPTRNWYAGIEGGRSSGGDPDLGHDASFGYYAGRRIDDRWSAELFTRHFGLANAVIGGIFGSDGQFRAEAHWGLAGTYRWALSETVSVRARLGLGYTLLRLDPQLDLSGNSTEQSEEKTIVDPSVGAALEVGTTRAVGLRLEATHFTRSKVNTVLLGVQANF